MVFLFQFVNVVYYVDCFADIEESLHPWDKAHLVMMYDLFNMFNTNPLSIASFANIFFHSISSLFVLLIVLFAVQKFLSLTRSHLFIFAFISNSLEVGHRGSCCDLCQRVFCLCSLLGVL